MITQGSVLGISEKEKCEIFAVVSKKFERGVKEAIHIGVAKLSLNKDGGRYLLPAVRPTCSGSQDDQ